MVSPLEMSQIPEFNGAPIPPNQLAFLAMIAVSEGTSTSPATKNNGYDVIVTGIDGKPEIFTDYKAHPFAKGRKPKIINSKGLMSTASGRYQFLLHDWGYYQMMLNLKDFGPQAQDRWALQLIRERRALPLIDTGRITEAVFACRTLWASLPGAGYAQHENSLTKLLAAYKAANGTGVA